MATLGGDERSRAREIDLLRFQVGELDSAGIHEIAVTEAGGQAAFEQRPNYVHYCEPLSPLVANEEALRKCVYLAEKGLPMTYIPLNAGGVNSPGTTAGCMATMNAGTLLGIVLSQLVRLPVSSLERAESLEQLRWLENGYQIKVVITEYDSPEVDLPEDIARMEKIIEKSSG